jgi:hypothetical protein
MHAAGVPAVPVPRPGAELPGSRRHRRRRSGDRLTPRAIHIFEPVRRTVPGRSGAAGYAAEPAVPCRSCAMTTPVTGKLVVGDLKLFELKTMCLLVTLSDRGGCCGPPRLRSMPRRAELSWLHGNCASQAVSCWTVENSVFTSGSPSSWGRVPLARLGLGVLEHELDHYFL